MTKEEKKKEEGLSRPPVVAVMGHIDHGKSTLLDYIRKSNVVEGEAGGITQHVSAYQAKVKDEDGNDRLITFLDTPGHEAFKAMRSRGADTADIAILVVAADDGVNEQTKEAYKEIEKSKIPFIVAINKIDLPGANLEGAKNSLVENGIYIEGYGGNIPYVPISAKTGEGVDELLSMIVLVVDLEDLKYNKEPASGVVLESHVDKSKGIASTLIVREGVLDSGQFVVAGSSFAPTRIMENFMGEKIEQAIAGTPVHIVGFSNLPKAGEIFETTDSKKEAEEKASENKKLEDELSQRGLSNTSEDKKMIPIVIKADTAGTRDAVLDELQKIENEKAAFLVLDASTGPIGEADVKLLRTGDEGIVVGFCAKPDKNATQLAEQLGIKLKTFNIIYELKDWLEKTLEEMAPIIDVEESSGKAKILKVFSSTKNKYVIGMRIDDGVFKKGDSVKVLRRENEIERGKILELRRGKEEVPKVESPEEAGARIESKIEIVPGDYIESFKVVQK